MLINSLTESSNGRYLIQFDNGQELRSTFEAVTDLRLYSGKDVDDALLERIKVESAKYLTFKKASELLSLRMMSGKELKEKLLQKGYDELSSDFSVSRLYELGLLNDEEYAAAIVRHYVAKGYGEGRIRAEFSRRGISRELWDDALSKIPSQDSKLESFISSHLKNPDDREQQKKVSAALFRRGYSWEEIRSAMQRYTTEEF